MKKGAGGVRIPRITHTGRPRPGSWPRSSSLGQELGTRSPRGGGRLGPRSQPFAAGPRPPTGSGRGEATPIRGGYPAREEEAKTMIKFITGRLG